MKRALSPRSSRPRGKSTEPASLRGNAKGFYEDDRIRKHLRECREGWLDGWRCSCREVRHTIEIEYDEIRFVFDEECMTHWLLRQDVVIVGELFKANTIITRVGNKPVPKRSDEAKKLIQRCVDRRRPLRVQLRAPVIPFPWCMLLRFPCLTILLNLAWIVALLVSGIKELNIDTSTESFMDSDGAASLKFNTLRDASEVKDEYRSLHSVTDPAVSSELPSRRLEERRRRRRRSDIHDDDSAKVSGVDADELIMRDEWISYGEGQPRRLQTKLWKIYRFSIIYTVQEGDADLLNGEMLSAIRSYERRLRALPAFQAVQKRTLEEYSHLSDPGVSFVNAAFASSTESSPIATGDEMRFLRLDGDGLEVIPLNLAVDLARKYSYAKYTFPKNTTSGSLLTQPFIVCSDQDPMCQKFAAQGRCNGTIASEAYMRDFCPDACGLCRVPVPRGLGASGDTEPERLQVAQSVFYFHAFCCYNDAQRVAMRDEADALFDVLLSEVSKFVSSSGGLLPQPLQAFYLSTGMEFAEAMRALAGDLKWGAISYLFVTIYATIYLRSVLLSCVGLFFILLSIPAALSVFFMVSGVGTLSLMNCLSVFIVIGIGSDMLFVYTDFWKQSLSYSRDTLHRMKFVYVQAASSTAATTFTTAMSFFANLASVLRPLREFGFFMGTCVSLAWLIVFLAYPALLVLGERCHRRAQRLLLRAAAPSDASSGIVSMMMTSTSTRFAQALDPESTHTSVDINGFLGEYYAPVLYRLRFFVIVAFVALTLWSGWMCMAFAQQDSEVPQIFPPDHIVSKVKPYQNSFEIFDAVSAREIRADFSGSQCTNLFRKCDLHECASVGTEFGSKDDCECFVHGRFDFTRKCSSVGVRIAVVGTERGEATLDRAKETVASYFQPATVVSDAGSLTSGSLYCLQWDTGRETFRTVTVTPTIISSTLLSEHPACAPGASFHGDLVGRELLASLQVNGTSEIGLDLACCAACGALSTCEFWIRESGESGSKSCWLKRGPLGHMNNTSRQGGFRPSDLSSNSSVSFEDLEGDEIQAFLEEQAFNVSQEAGDQDCCQRCGADEDCEFWLRSGGVCRLMRNPRQYSSPADDEPPVRGGWRCQGTIVESYCEEDWACYCGAQPCSDTNTSEPRGRIYLETDATERRLQASPMSTSPPTTVPVSQRTEVMITFGIEVTNSNPLLGESSGQPFGFLETFQMEDPWAQRLGLALCTEFPDELKVATTRCWLADFSEHRLSRGESWPIRDTDLFHQLAFEYTTQTSKKLIDYVWFEKGRVRAMFTSAYLDFSKFSGSGPAYDLMQEWDKHLDEFNGRAEECIKGTWHTSSLWVRAEAETVIVDSTLVTICISLGCVLVGVGIFTRSLALALMVMVAVLAVIICLLFYMVVIMGWKIGAIEVLSLIVFVGFAVDYCFHIAHKYHSCHVTDVESADATSSARGHSVRSSGRNTRRESGVSNTSGSTVATLETRIKISISEVRTKKSSLAAKELRKENQPTERYERTRYSLSRMGSSVMSSALTTIGCAAFLLPCNIYIFLKIGSVVMGVTSYAVVYAMLPLPAALMIIGPANHDFSSLIESVRWLIGFTGIEDELAEDMRRHREALRPAPPRRRFVLHMPFQGVAAVGERGKPTRTEVTALG